MSARFGNIITIIALAVIAFVVLSVAFRPPTPTLEVEECSLNTKKTKINKPVTLTIRIKNNDKEQSHSFKVEFESHSLVTFFLGGQQLPKENNIWYFTDILNPSAELTQPITVKADLEPGISKLDYSIIVKFYINDEQFSTKNLKLTVER